MYRRSSRLHYTTHPSAFYRLKRNGVAWRPGNLLVPIAQIRVSASCLKGLTPAPFRPLAWPTARPMSTIFSGLICALTPSKTSISCSEGKTWPNLTPYNTMLLCWRRTPPIRLGTVFMARDFIHNHLRTANTDQFCATTFGPFLTLPAFLVHL